LKQALAYDNKLISHFYDFGDRSFILHGIVPDDLGHVRFRPSGRGQIIKTSLYQKLLLDVVVLSAFSESLILRAIFRRFWFSALLCEGANGLM
jgi:hypothetical protein